MTLKELCIKYGYSESSVKSKWSQVQKSILKKTGVKIEKIGRGSNISYEEQVPADNRAIVMFEETKDAILMNKDVFTYENLEFTCFLGIVLTPMMVFRGSYLDLTRYIGLEISSENIERVKNAIFELKNRNIVFVYEDHTTEREVVTITLVAKAEEEMKIGITMIQTCKRLADENHKHSWVPLLKTWIGMQVMSESQPFTTSELESLTGLSAYQIRENKRILEQNDVFKTSKAYISYTRCVGQNVDLNVFEEGNL